MTFIPMMWSIWGLFALIAICMVWYRASLTRDEDDQLFLTDAFQHERVAQQAIIERVKKVEPAVRISIAFAAAASLFVIVYYVRDFIHQFN